VLDRETETERWWPITDSKNSRTSKIKSTLRSRAGARDELVAENERLLAEREAIRIKVQRILEKIDAVDPEIAEAISG